MGHEEFSDGMAEEFNQALEGRWNPAAGAAQFNNPDDVLNAAYIRMAGDTELPGDLNVLKNLLLKGRVEVHTGAVTVTRDGSFEVAPSNSNWGLRGSFGYDPSVMVNYQSSSPQGRAPTPPGVSVGNALLELEQSY